MLFQFFTNRTWAFDGSVDTHADFWKQMASLFCGRVFTLVVEEVILEVFITWLSFNTMAVEIPVISHTHSGALRTVRRGKTLVGIIVHQVCDIVQNPLIITWTFSLFSF